MLPDWIKDRLRRRENGRDIFVLTVNLKTIKSVFKKIKAQFSKKKKSRIVKLKEGDKS